MMVGYMKQVETLLLIFSFLVVGVYSDFLTRVYLGNGNKSDLPVNNIESQGQIFLPDIGRLSTRRYFIRADNSGFTIRAVQSDGRTISEIPVKLTNMSTDSSWQIQLMSWNLMDFSINFIAWSSNSVLFVSVFVETGIVKSSSRFNHGETITKIQIAKCTERFECFVSFYSSSKTSAIFLDSEQQLNGPIPLDEMSISYIWLKSFSKKTYAVTTNDNIFELDFKALKIMTSLFTCPASMAPVHISWSPSGTLLLACAFQNGPIFIYTVKTTGELILLNNELLYRNFFYLTTGTNQQVVTVSQQPSVSNLVQLFVVNQTDNMWSIVKKVNLGPTNTVKLVSLQYSRPDLVVVVLDSIATNVLCPETGLYILAFNLSSSANTSSPPPSVPSIDSGAKQGWTMNTILVSATVSFSLILIAFAVIYYFSSKKNINVLKSFRTLFSLVETNSQDVNGSNEWDVTVVNTDRELSIPGYLEMDINSCFRPKKTIMLSEKTQVIVATILNKEVQEASNLNECVLKVLNGIDRKTFLQEVSVMAYFRDNEHFAKIIGFSINEKVICMKYYRLGSLHRWIHRKEKTQIPPYSVDCVQFFSMDIGRALLAMHEAGFIHYDLKPQNVFLDTRKTGEVIEVYAVLADFGGAYVVDSPSLLVSAFELVEKKEATLRYAPPEIIRRFVHSCEGPRNWNSDQSKAVDVYSYGMVLFELLAREEPFDEVETVHELMASIDSECIPEINQETMSRIQKSKVLTEIYEIMRDCTTLDPEGRPKIQEVVNRLSRLTSA